MQRDKKGKGVEKKSKKGGKKKRQMERKIKVRWAKGIEK